jgi:hypothetical protein
MKGFTASESPNCTILTGYEDNERRHGLKEGTLVARLER